MGKLNGKTAVITGAGSGIGRASALVFAGEGATVVVADINRAGGDETVRQVVAAGGSAAFVHVDVVETDSVRALIDDAVSRFGRLDVLFNNAGIGGTYGSFSDTTEEMFDRVIAINLRGVFLGMKYGIAAMLKQGGGVIINTASVAGMIGAPGYAAYAASKGGVIQLTKVAALEYAKQNIRVNCICPGGVDTPILAMVPAAARSLIGRSNPMQRLGRPEEIASMALFLACDDSSFATGAQFVVDGGSAAQ